MAITSSLSCVDYLSIKFGCQSLNADKEIYNHLSQDWFFRPFINEFSKNDVWSEIFEDAKLSAEKGKVVGKRAKYNKRQKLGKISYKNNKNRGFCENFKIVEHNEERISDSCGCEDEQSSKKEGKYFLNYSTLETRDKSLSSAGTGKDIVLTESYDEDYYSESEQELLQIYKCDDAVEVFRDYIEPTPLKLFRKRTSTECLDRMESENVAKRMRPSINLTKMHESRFASRYECEDSERFIPINLGQECRWYIWFYLRQM